MVTWQVPVPEQPPPLQPAKVEGGVAAAVSVTTVLLVKVYEQVEPQLMPGGLLVTEPVPVPARLTVKVLLPDGSKLAVTDWAVLMVTVQVPVPEQPAPLQPPKVEGDVATAVSVTTVLYVKTYEQVEPQLMPGGLLVTEPLPVPPMLTFNVYVLLAS